MARNRTRKKEKVFVPQGNAYVRATFNNTIITMTDNSGNVFLKVVLVLKDSEVKKINSICSSKSWRICG
ncbi:MAG: hypothetical protein Ct9H90mP2_10740 [Dehalococcoidia bacterium]|nr:MAG: hypothetical protein Ct9H90mP2_10740 [Dehalococcoidia bacterium]